MWRFAHRSPACSASVALTFRHVHRLHVWLLVAEHSPDANLGVEARAGWDGHDVDPAAAVVVDDDHRRSSCRGCVASM